MHMGASSTSHTTRVVAERIRGKWILGLYIYYSNLSLLVINLKVLDKYESKHTGIWKNVQANIGKCISKKERTDRR